MKLPAGILLGLGVVLAAIWGWNSEWGQLLTGRWSFTESVSTDTGTYFRLQVKVAYKGEPVDFDIVVGCNVRRTGYKDGSSSVEVGIVPAVFGKRMSDNKGLVVGVPDACGERYIKGGWIPDDLLPVMVVYDDADTLAFGTAYLSEDAYDSPLSVLRFERATITAATRQEFDAFRREQTNLVSRNAYHSASKGVELLRPLGLDVTVPFGGICHAYQRFRIPEELREQIRQAWPAERPRYWWPGSKQLFDARQLVQPDIGGPFQQLNYLQPGGSYSGRGILRRNGGGLIQPPGSRRPAPIASYYPLISDIQADKWPLKMDEWPDFINKNSPFIGERIDFRNGDTRGFAYCYLMQTGDPGARDFKERLEMQALRVGATAYREVDKIPIAGAPKTLGSNMLTFIEGDEFFFRKVDFGVVNAVRGDV